VPAFAAPFLGFALGGIFSWLGREELSRCNTSLESRSFSVVTFFTLLIYAPIYCYLLGFATDWCFGYYIDPTQRTLPLMLLLSISTALSPVLGFVGVGIPAARQRFAAVVRLIATSLLIALTSLVPGVQRLAMDATYAQYHDDFGGGRLIGSSLGYGLLWMGSILSLGAIWAGRAVTRLANARV
jgi:hypothetical protein